MFLFARVKLATKSRGRFHLGRTKARSCNYMIYDDLGADIRA